MSGVQLNWKMIRRVLPRASRYALDRVLTLDELREILDAADIRGKRSHSSLLAKSDNTTLVFL